MYGLYYDVLLKVKLLNKVRLLLEFSDVCNFFNTYSSIISVKHLKNQTVSFYLASTCNEACKLTYT